jgi:hypothetical protein
MIPFSALAAEKDDLIHELIEEMNMVDLAKQSTQIMMTQMGAVMADQMRGLAAEHEDAQNNEELMQIFTDSYHRMMDRLQEEYMKEVQFEDLIDEIYVPIYDKYFTEDEIRDLLDFYKSPTGKKMLEKSPDLMRESMQKATLIINPIMNRISQRVGEEETARLMKEIQKFQRENEIETEVDSDQE